MKGEFEVNVRVRPLPLSRASSEALRHLERYDAILLTSKHAEALFRQRTRRRTPHLRIIRVGPRNDLLTFDLAGKRVLFPRSALAPADIVRKLRAKDCIVRVIVLYTATDAPLSRAQRRRFRDGTTKQLYFKSPSGIRGLLRQCRGRYREAVLSLPARCIGETTAQAARDAGFKRVFIR